MFKRSHYLWPRDNKSVMIEGLLHFMRIMEDPEYKIRFEEELLQIEREVKKSLADSMWEMEKKKINDMLSPEQAVATLYGLDGTGKTYHQMGTSTWVLSDDWKLSDSEPKMKPRKPKPKKPIFKI